MIRGLSTYKLKQSHVLIVVYSAAILLVLTLLLAFQIAKPKEAGANQDFSSLKLPPYDPNSPTFHEEIDKSRYLPSIVPVDLMDGRVSSEFGMRIHPVHGVRAMHPGIDLAVDTGTPVVATADGVVEFASVRGGYGKLVIIDHLDEIKTRYAHLSVIKVKVGDFVERGDIIGLVGATGVVTGPHLHYEVRLVDEQHPIKGLEHNPREFFPENFEAVAKESKEESDVGGD